MRILITIPTWNEAIVISRTMEALCDACARLLRDHDVTIEVADNGSTDGTGRIVETFVAQHGNRLVGTTYLPIVQKGKGLAIRTSWVRHRDDVDAFVFMDADLAADLNALPALIRPIVDGSAHLVCGSRFAPGARAERKPTRNAASRAYRWLQQRMLALPVQDAQCGFKAASRRLVRDIVPSCAETGWMFDTELIAKTARRGFTILEIPVSWKEQRNRSRRSALSLWKHGWGFVTGLFRIKKGLTKPRIH